MGTWDGINILCNWDKHESLGARGKTVLERIMAIQRFSRTCEYVTLYGKRDFADGTKLRILRWQDYPGLSGWLQCNHKCLYKGKEGGRQSQRRQWDNGSRDQRWGQWGERFENITTLLHLKTEGGTTNQGMQWLLEAGKGKKMDSPLEPTEGMQHLPTPWFFLKVTNFTLLNFKL